MHRGARLAVALAVVAVAAAVVAPALGARAASVRPIASYCSPSGDLCFAVMNRDGTTSLEISTFAKYFDRYTLCVRPPVGATTCKSFAIRRIGVSYGSRVVWCRNFARRGPGVYRVTWKRGASRLGPALTFRRTR